MTRIVRNFWVEGDAGHTRVATGPRGKDGTLDVSLYIRDDGDIRHAFDVLGRVGSDGTLRLTVTDPAGNILSRVTTTR